MIVHTYPPLLSGKLVKRYKRFFADIELDSGEIVTAHCANTGPMTSVSTVGSAVYVSQNQDPKRKLKYSWEMILVEQTWVGINTSLPNRVVGHMLKHHLLPELEPYDTIQPEVAYGNEKSRIDFMLTGDNHKTFVEVKNTTWNQGNIALFPDTVTTRGQKHMRELIAIMDANTKSTLIYFINRSDCDEFAPGTQADPEYGRLVKEAIASGVKILPCRFHVTPKTIEYLGLAKMDL
jgi:sugar fermentation stimulation protein A